MKAAHQRSILRAITITLGMLVFSGLSLIHAQTPKPPPQVGSTQNSASNSGERLVKDIEARLSAIEQDSSLQEAEKQGLVSKYHEAIKWHGEAEANRTRTNEYREAALSAPRETAELTRQLEALSAQDNTAKVDQSSSTEQLDKEVDLRRASLLELETQLKSSEGQLSQLSERPAQIALRLPKAQEELAAVESSIGLLGQAGEDNQNRAAERIRLEAHQAALESEIEMLREEQGSQPAREARLAAQRKLLESRLDREKEDLAALESALQEQRLSEAERISNQVTRLANQFPEPTEETSSLIDELKGLALELQEVTSQLEELSVEHDEISSRFDLAESKFRRIQEQVRLGGLSGNFGQTLIAQYRTLGNPRELELSINDRQQTLREIRLADFEVEAKLEEQKIREKQLGPDVTDQEKQLLATRIEILEKLQNSYREVIDDLLRVDSKSRDLKALILEFRGFLNEKLFWLRSSPAAGREIFTELPDSLSWFFSAHHASQLASSLGQSPKRHPFLFTAILAILAVLFVKRRRLEEVITTRGNKIRRISSDRYRHTAVALGGTLLLALPISFALGFMGWSFVRDPEIAGWLQGLGLGLLWAAAFLGTASFIRSCCRPGGLAPVHFGWDETTTTLLYSKLLKILVPYVAILMVTSSTLYASDPQQLGILGRLGFVIAQLWLAFGFWTLLRPSGGLFAKTPGDHPRGLLSRTRSFWIILVIAEPIATAGLALSGYILTAFALNAVFLTSLGLIIAGVILYSLTLRWFMIKERKMAFAEALEERRARREAADSQENESDEPVPADEVERELDLDDISTQTRRLLHSLASISVILLLWWYWERSLPIAALLGNRAIGDGISFLSLAQAILIIAVAITVIRNLPGLLDLAGFRNSGIDPGTRYAISTIFQYTLGALALTLLARILGLDWSQFGWIAAALSVGLGFGLQEVVANFVCGIILLFERPIRRGDVVTIDGVTGTVSRIKMRATTITNWDRQDYVVPNKQLITGSLTNWTLANTINRIVIPIGVAYGSDTGRALQMLRDVANEHPLIMDDPAPLVSFESFGDSTLDLVLRCFLANMDNRLKTITELHSEIDRRFNEAGIEIAFPQQDLHIRSIDRSVELELP